MEITNDNRRVHQELSNCSLKFLEFVKRDSERLKRSNYSTLETHDPKRVLQPWPTFICPRKKDELQKASTEVFKIIKTLLQRFFSYDPEKISRFFEFPLDHVKYFLYGVNEEHINNLLARGDFIFSPSGFKCIEYNICSNLGGGQIPVWEAMYLKTPIISEFLHQYGIKVINKNLLAIFLKHIITLILKKIPNISGELNIVIAFSDKAEMTINNPREHFYVNQLYEDILHQKYRPLKGEIIFCDYSQLIILEDHIYYHGKEVHFILEFNNGTAPFKFRLVQEKGNVLIYNGLITALMENKLNIALMSEYQDSDIFTPEERETIKKYIPWTRKVKYGETTHNSQSVKLEDFILSNREQLVLKPAGGLSGIDVHLGYKTPENQWRQVKERALQEKDWVVQERIDSYPFLYQHGKEGYAEHNVNWGTFVFGTRYAGTWLRVQPKTDPEGIINFSHGAEASILFEVDE
jgi:hypothetical protein